jgi:uncharacterized protein YndB with AHSA1/START domain
MRHSPEKFWRALTDPAQLREWAPFDSDGSLGTVGTTVKLTTVGAGRDGGCDQRAPPKAIFCWNANHCQSRAHEWKAVLPRDGNAHL